MAHKLIHTSRNLLLAGAFAFTALPAFADQMPAPSTQPQVPVATTQPVAVTPASPSVTPVVAPASTTAQPAGKEAIDTTTKDDGTKVDVKKDNSKKSSDLGLKSGTKVAHKDLKSAKSKKSEHVKQEAKLHEDNKTQPVPSTSVAPTTPALATPAPVGNSK